MADEKKDKKDEKKEKESATPQKGNGSTKEGKIEFVNPRFQGYHAFVTETWGLLLTEVVIVLLLFGALKGCEGAKAGWEHLKGQDWSWGGNRSVHSAARHVRSAPLPRPVVLNTASTIAPVFVSAKAETGWAHRYLLPVVGRAQRLNVTLTETCQVTVYTPGLWEFVFRPVGEKGASLDLRAEVEVASAPVAVRFPGLTGRKWIAQIKRVKSVDPLAKVDFENCE